MSRRRLLPAAVALATAALSGESAAQYAPGWQVSGTNTARGEHYGTSGDRTQSPYQLDLGNMAYDELNLVARLQDSPYSLWRFSVSGVVNGSPYRSPYDGVVPERLNALRERTARRRFRIAPKPATSSRSPACARCSVR